MIGKPEADPLIAFSRSAMARGSRSFTRAARLFPRPVRDNALLLYAWCRHCDDEIDDQQFGSAPGAAARGARGADRLARLRMGTVAALEGAAVTEPAFQSLQRVVQQCGVPHRYPLELLEGLERDVKAASYGDLQETLTYCYLVAGTVGAMMASVMGARDPALLLRGVHLGIAMQLSNIARDVMDDAAVDRVYLPADWLRAAGVAPSPEAVLRHPEAVASVVRRLLEAAEPYYRSAGHGIRRLPFRCACAVGTAARLYRAIGTEVASRGGAAWRQRAVVPSCRQGALALAAIADRATAQLRSVQEPEDEALFALPTAPPACR